MSKLRPCRMSRDEFMSAFGHLYEHSPWIAARVFEQGLDVRHDVPGYLHESFRQVILAADSTAQAGLLRAHPPLACGREDLTHASQQEQAGAGLDQCSDSEFAEFGKLNESYRQRFGFPFIVAVRGRHRTRILELFRERIQRNPDEEFQEALEQVCLIGKYRLAERFHG